MPLSVAKLHSKSEAKLADVERSGQDIEALRRKTRPSLTICTGIFSADKQLIANAPPGGVKDSQILVIVTT